MTDATPQPVDHQISPGARPRELTHIEQREHPDWAAQVVIPPAPSTITPNEDPQK